MAGSCCHNWNCDMQKGLVWYFLFGKENLKKKTTWIFLLAMLLLLYLISEIHMPSADNLVVGFMPGESRYGKEMESLLTGSDSRFKFRMYKDKKNLYRDVESGKLECGFLPDPGMDEKIKKEDLRYCVRYIASPYTTKGEIAKETVFAVFFRLYSNEILKENEESIFGNHSENRMKAIYDSNVSYTDSDFFKIDVITVKDTGESRQGTKKCYPLQGIFVLFLMAAMYFSNGLVYEAGGKWVRSCFTGTEGFLFSLVRTYAAVTLPAVVGLVLILMLPESRGAGEETIRLVLFLLIGVPWTVFITSFTHKPESFAAFGLALTAVSVLIYPVFFRLEVFLPAVRYLSYLTPTGIFLNG